MILAFGKHAVSFSLRGFRFHGKTVRDIYVVGVPSIVMNAIGTVMTMAMNGILAAFSAAAVNVFGVYFKLQSFVFMPVFGLTQGLMPIMGYNYGARNKQRVTGAIKTGVIIALIINVVGTIIFELFPGELISIFNATDELLKIGDPALRIIAIHFPDRGGRHHAFHLVPSDRQGRLQPCAVAAAPARAGASGLAAFPRSASTPCGSRSRFRDRVAHHHGGVLRTPVQQGDQAPGYAGAGERASGIGAVKIGRQNRGPVRADRPCFACRLRAACP